MLFRRVILVGALCGSTLGCSGGTTETAALPHPTIIEVSPDEFAAPPACGTSAGSLMRYVATLVDVTQEATGAGGDGNQSNDFALPSSGLEVEEGGELHYEPVPCLMAVNFGWVVSGHTYRADLLGFDRTDLRLLSPGLPVVVDSVTKEVVEPRWTSRCADYPNELGKPEGVRAETELTRTARDCDPWVEVAP